MTSAPAASAGKKTGSTQAKEGRGGLRMIAAFMSLLRAPSERTMVFTASDLTVFEAIALAA